MVESRIERRQSAFAGKMAGFSLVFVYID